MSLDNIKAKLKELFHEGNRRRLVVERDGKRYANVPLTIVVLACFLVFWLVALLAVIAFFLECKFSLETDEDESASAEPEPLAVPPPATEAETAPVVDLFDATEAAAAENAAPGSTPDAPVTPASDGPATARPARSLDDLS